MYKERKRKTKDPCLGCYMHKELCICSLFPLLHLKTKVTIIMYFKELNHPTNTGRLALKMLSHSDMIIRGDKTSQRDLSSLIENDFHPLLLFPCPEAKELDEIDLSSIKKPIHLLVPDGSWRQAKKVALRHPELKNVQRIKISTPNLNTHFIRKETSEWGMATLEAIALALGVLENKEVEMKILSAYRAKVAQTFKARGFPLDI